MTFNRRSVQVITPPSANNRVVSLSEAKDWLRLDECDDLVIGGLIDACVLMIKNYTKRSIASETYELTLDAPNRAGFDETRLGAGVHTMAKSVALGTLDGAVDLPYPIVTTIDSVKTYGSDNTEATYSSSNYRLDGAGGRLYLNAGATWPSDLRSFNSVVIRYTAGYTKDTIPADLKQAIKMHVAHLYECRQDCEIPPACKAILEGYRLFDYLAVY